MSVAVRRALYGKMAGDSTLTTMLHAAPTGRSQSIYHQLAPGNALFPYVIFHKQSGTPAYRSAGLPIDNELWLIKGLDRQHNLTASPDTVDGISSRLDALLTDGSISISGKTKLYLRRESDVEYSEPDGDQRIMHSGALFRLAYTNT